MSVRFLDTATGKLREWLNSINGAAYVDNPPYIYLEDNAGTYLYQGEAVSGSATSGSVWRISRTTLADNSVLWGDAGSFDNIWDNRATTVVYS